MHALGLVISGSDLGSQKTRFEKERDTAQEALSTYLEKDDPLEIAYWAGRVEVMLRFCARADDGIPPYFDPYKLVPTRTFKAGKRLEHHSDFVMKRFDKGRA